MYAVLHLPRFPLQAVLRHEPALWDRPVALVDPDMTTPRVVEATTPAREAGVTDGSTAPQALARCRTVMIRHRVPAQEVTAMDALLHCAYAFSPHLEATGPGVVTLDLRGLAELRPTVAAEGDATAEDRALNAWGERLRASVKSVGLDAWVGVGPTPNVARHAARWGLAIGTDDKGERDAAGDSPRGIRFPPHRGSARSTASGVRVVSDAVAFVAGLPVAALEPSSDVTVMLQRWGIRTVGELLALGQAALAERLGLEALGLFAAASVTASRPLKVAKPRECFEETHEFESEVETLEPLLFLLRRFTDSLSRRLEVYGWVARELQLRLRLESGQVLVQSLRVPQPTRRADALFRMLETLLESLRTDSPVKSVGLVAEPTQPEQRQFGLFVTALRDPNQFQETLARLAALVGADRVGSPVREDSHRPDAFTLVPPDFERETGGPLQRTSSARGKAQEAGAAVSPGGRPATPERRFMAGFVLADEFRPVPLRRLRPGVTAQVQWGEGEGHGGRPLAVQSAVASGRLVVSLGPWRSSGHWWESGGWEREEWDVSNRDGRVVRLVRVGDAWSVEGVLD